MIKEFLKLSIEDRARLVIWLYDRYVVKPALDEMNEIDMLFDLAEELQVELTLEKPSIH
jgi:hypothetical protein